MSPTSEEVGHPPMSTFVWACWDGENGSTLPASMATVQPARNTGVPPSVAIAPRTDPHEMATPHAQYCGHPYLPLVLVGRKVLASERRD